MPQHLLLPLYATLAGVSFGFLGVSYRLAQNYKLRTTSIMIICCVFGTAVFALQPAPSTPTPFYLYIFAFLSGFTQYLAIRLVQTGLQFGPLSPIWCMVSLFFLPPAIYAWLAYGQPLKQIQLLGLLLATVCAILASLQSEAGGKNKSARRLLYPVILLAILGCNSFANVVMTDMKIRPGYHPPLFETQTNRFIMIMYITLAACILLETAAGLLKPKGRSSTSDSDTPLGPTSSARYPWVAFILIALLAAAGSIFGMMFLRLSGDFSAAATFTLSGITSLLSGGLASVLFFRERASLRWYCMMLAGAAAIPLMNAV